MFQRGARKVVSVNRRQPPAWVHRQRMMADPVAMANAFRLGVEAGRTAYEAGLMESRDFASPSTPVVGTPFWHAVS